jgi:hypothetical protein
MESKRETRTINNAEVRMTEDGKTLIGHAAVFDRWTKIGDDEWGFQECVRAGAFKEDIESGADIRCLFNHDANCLLGRTTSKTLRLAEDASGLSYNCDLPDTQPGRDVRTSIARGDLSGCSFSFEVKQERWTEEKGEDGKVAVKRELLAVKLFDVGPVTFPAYEETDCHVRSLVEQHRPPAKDENKEKLEDIERHLQALHLAAEIEFSKTR